MLSVELHRAIYLDFETVSDPRTAADAQEAEHRATPQPGAEAEAGAGAGAGAGASMRASSAGVASGMFIGHGQSEMYLPSVASASPRPPARYGASAAGHAMGATSSLHSAPSGLGGEQSLDYFRGTTYVSRARALQREILEMQSKRYVRRVHRHVCSPAAGTD